MIRDIMWIFNPLDLGPSQTVRCRYRRIAVFHAAPFGCHDRFHIAAYVQRQLRRAGEDKSPSIERCRQRRRHGTLRRARHRSSVQAIRHFEALPFDDYRPDVATCRPSRPVGRLPAFLVDDQPGTRHGRQTAVACRRPSVLAFARQP